MSRHILICLTILLLSWTQQFVSAQPGYEVDIKKPKPYENRVLESEKTDKKKFKFTRHVMQNASTHFNYYFNANNKLNDILARAKAAHIDDYGALLSFYNYNPDALAQDKSQLDSIIYKAKSGIVLHDLRNDWTDDLYLLWGTAYYLQKKFDSAYQMFQFINYAYADKEKDGYYKYIGSAMDGNNALSIATKEKQSLPQKLMGNPPSRNNALIWQIRTLTETNNFTEAGNLINVLKNDPAFPERLQSSLEEAQAYWCYRQQKWDSAAAHLVNALDNAGNKLERARWEYLAAQLYEKSGKFSAAEDYYNKSVAHTTDPIMDIYARLNLIRINKTGGDQYIDQNIAALVKMAGKDKYEDYRDVIYFMAAQMEMARNNPIAAREFILRGAKYNRGNTTSRNQSYLQLADLLFAQKKYKPASGFYDSLQTNTLVTADADRANFRRPILARLVSNMNIVDRQDSLQRIAALPEDERKALIKKLVRQLRYQQGLKEEGVSDAPVTSLPDPFSAPAKGDWYFYNANLKAQGSASFKQLWGNRPNVDNWRRIGDVTAILRNNNPNNTRGYPGMATVVNTAPTADALTGNLPLTPALLQKSNDSIQGALYTLGHIYADDLEDYATAIETFEALKSRFPQYANMSDVVFQLYYSYSKTGNGAQAAQLKKLLLEKYPTSRYASIINTGIDPASAKPSALVTKTYEHIYDLFIEGQFADAEIAKKNADSTYHTNYWSPQLLYIEAVYHVKQREDSTAIKGLNTIVKQNPGSPLAAKAANLIMVLQRRKQIEKELTDLQIERPKEDTAKVVIINPPVIKKRDSTVTQPEENLPVIRRDTSTVNTKAVVMNKSMNKTITDSLTKKILPTASKSSSSLFTFNTEAPHNAMVILNKVDVVFGNEARNAFTRYNKEKYYNQPLDIQLLNIDDDNKLLVISNFINAQSAIEYVQKTKQLAGTEIVPWLKGDKYSFSIISVQNLEALKNHPDLNAYKKFLEQNLPVKF